MNSLLARNFSKGGHSLIHSFSGGAIPTSSTLQSGAYKVVGLDHLSTPAMRSAYRKKTWLSDPATYPLIVCLGGAVALCSGFGIHFLVTAPDVQISPLKRSKTIRDWH
ncbi:hypothetical protein ACHAWO_005023 [Cyclotella atomus]|uniref:Uncharacterized protein n=1 Tax=Cyclotella atomus TaxID=382360 RepID=A0ABD3PUX7_9STRA